MDDVVVFLGRIVCDLAGTFTQGTARCYDVSTLRTTGYWSLGLVFAIAIGRRIVR